ncbi:MAG: hypothetical protein V4622_05370 [Bacteroidota bacterium]
MGTLAQLFETGEQTSQKGHFRNLILIARYDGKILETEKKLLNRIAQKLSLTDEQVKEILDNQDTYQAIPPYSREERYERFVQLVQMAMIDGIMSHEELALVKKLGVSLGFSEETIETKTKVIIDKINSGLTRDEILEVIL